MAHIWSSKTIDSVELAVLNEWLDKLPLSKERTKIENDFCDGYLAAEIINSYFPNLIKLKEYRTMTEVKERISQWKMLNQKAFRKIFLNVPSHVITQLSIAKAGVAQIFLNNLRISISLTGANTPKGKSTPKPLPPEPKLIAIPHIDLDQKALYYRYNNSLNLIRNFPGLHPREFEYQWQKKQIKRALKDVSVHNGTKKLSKKSHSDNELLDQKLFLKLPPLARYTPHLIGPYVSVEPVLNNRGLAAVKVDDIEKIQEQQNQLILLKNQLTRLELLLISKDEQIKELRSELEMTKKNKAYKYKH